MDLSCHRKNKRPKPPKIPSTQSSSSFSFYKSESSVEPDSINDESTPRKFLKAEHESTPFQHDPVSSFSPTQKSLPTTQQDADQLAFQDISFDHLPESQDITWSQTHSEIEDSQTYTPFLFDAIEIHENKHVEKAESVISDFSDDDNQSVKLSAYSKAQSFDQIVTIEDAEDKDETESIISDFSNDDPIAMPVVNRSNSPPSVPLNIEQKPHTVEFYLPSSKIPKPILPPFRQLRASNNSKFVQLKRKGLADTALQTILTERTLFDRWEYEINGHMAKYGSMAKTCQKQSVCPLYRMTETWLEGGLVFSWCVPLDHNTIVVLDTSQKNTQTESTNDMASQSTSWSFATPNYILPEYESSQDRERILFAFSFAYMHNVSKMSINKFVNEEKVVGIWSGWTEYDATLADYGAVKVNLVTKFKADSIY